MLLCVIGQIGGTTILLLGVAIAWYYTTSLHQPLYLLSRADRFLFHRTPLRSHLLRRPALAARFNGLRRRG